MSTSTGIYFDNAATAGYRPQAVIDAVVAAMTGAVANPGRSGHLQGVKAARVLEEARNNVAAFFGVADPSHIVFTKNATEALNVVIRGALKPGDTVLASSFEHNATMRPLRFLERTQGIRIEDIPTAGPAPVDLEWLAKRIAQKPPALVAVMVASNVTGQIMPYREVAALCREHGVFYLGDGAQGAGILPLQAEADGFSALTVTGHKGMMGPRGVGVLYLREPERVEPLVMGGTGSRSDEDVQPDFMPDKFEGGTANLPGIAGLDAGVKILRAEGLPARMGKMRALTVELLEGLRAVPGVTIVGPSEADQRVATVSFTLQGRRTSDIATVFNQHDIACRTGLHCAPRAHRALGTFPDGTARLSLSTWNTSDEIAQVCEVLRAFALATENK